MYCGNCGKPMQSDAIYCTNCGWHRTFHCSQGHEVPEESTFCTVDGELLQRKSCPNCGARVDQCWNYCSECGTWLGQPDADAPNRKRLVLIGVAAAVIAALVVVFVVVLSNESSVVEASVTVPDLSGLTQDAATSQIEANNLVLGTVVNQYNDDFPEGRVISQDPAAGSSVDSGGAVDLVVSQGSEPDPEPDPSPSQDEQFHDAIVTSYNRLSGYDSRIKDVATTFNNHYLSGSVSERASYAATARSLLSELKEQRSNLYALSQPSNSSYSTQFSLLKRCYDDCVERVDCIVRSWNISLAYADPSDHKDEIIAPLSEEMDGTQNRYKTDYDSIYPQINL